MKRFLKTKGNIILSILLPIGVCFFVILIKNMENYVELTYNLLPFYAIKVSLCILIAAITRIFLAVIRKSTHSGSIKISLPAIIAVCLFIGLGIGDWIYGFKVLLINPHFDVSLFFSILCIIERRRINAVESN